MWNRERWKMINALYWILKREMRSLQWNKVIQKNSIDELSQPSGSRSNLVLLPCNILKSCCFFTHLTSIKAFQAKIPNPPPKHCQKNKQRRDSSVWQACGWYTGCDVASLCTRTMASKIAVSSSMIWFHACQTQNGSKVVQKLFSQTKLRCG